MNRFCPPPCVYHPWQQHFPALQIFATQFDRDHFDHELLNALPGMLPDSIRRSAAKRQADFLSGRLCALSAMAALQLPPMVPGIGEDRSPQWPAGVVGSITHGAGLALAAVACAADCLGVGIDVETLQKPDTMHSVAEQVLTPHELHIRALLPDMQQADFISTVFSLKESLYKALYPIVGKSFYFQDAELVAWQAETVSLRLLTDLSDVWCANATLTGHYVHIDGRVISLVVILPD
ncbi:enterobactin synthetase component D [Chitinivorax tropicus]|uniref:Enterobactin synthase component D n=1 Tax=Chitinivorax tropicus TaxID=714531 RepID=A0A840MQL7_9PROT|nr:4'-phosphopantetheinyl transferase superfamily protein [Chitinivorax tropicus]MBB5018473.1 enterobactin synthetase component D [Chitinivorax tropicus]